jgi:hypothetical protein
VKLCFGLVHSIFLEISDMRDSHSCAWTCRAIASFCAGLGRCLKVKASGASPWKDTSWAISARALTLNVPVPLITIGNIWMSALIVP